ncbi:hypothetical protein PHYSODRAFT_554633 [Phytophthora sojae]|uniref:EF-hand domain-containing protein n=1 Tax=Phytophthora sojae (strain P6497) TaxID=1094619 RepID=G4YWX5_PHYSP|nr:hypothetical protein PHYSODRAFT_554633 [Phytophthora sojae]EGZ24473.1 hypothetical protein PHYSODRAFT_554633 [Phytophthora sojae]|eukprot:XP_009519761.1 hypothetical protein PHYSODRAFT_554633 [Phytophthora sojae]
MGGGSLFQVGEAVEFWRVLIHLSILAFCLVLFEALLHHVEHKLSRHDKYQHMLRKAYRELMILGLLSLGLKLLKEVPGIHADSKTMLAFQVADLAIFILALALILQAIIVFSQLRKHNKVADRTELITAQDLVDALSPPAGTPPTSGPVHGGGGSSCWPRKTTGAAFDKEVVERRLLRHLFLRRFGLPQLFPFSKYLRRAQANQISHMIEVEPSMWVLLLAVAWGICGFVAMLDEWDVDLPESHELVETLMIFGWLLLVVHVVVMLYFRWSLRQLLDAAGYSDNEAILVDNLRAIAEEEALAWQNEAADTALDTMNRVQEELEEIEDRRNAERHVLLRKDVGLQLVATCCRNMNQIGVAKLRTGRVPSGVQPGTPHINIRFFSRKAWHVTVMFLLILNGFFIALLVQCAVYDLDDIYEDFGLLPAILVPLPLILNTFVFQQRMFRHFVIVCSVLRVDSNTLGEVVNHFSEIVEMRTEFGSSLLECLKEGDYTIVDLRRELHAYDPKQTGLIDVDTLRYVLASFGFRLTRFRFNSVAMMLFELNGTRVEYGQLFRLLMLAQNEHQSELAGSQVRRQHPLLQRSQTSLDDGGRGSLRANHVAAPTTGRQVPLLSQPSLGSEPRPSDFVNVSHGPGGLPPMRPVSVSAASDTNANVKTENGTRPRPPMLERSYTHQFAGSSSRALHDMFNIRRVSASQSDTVPSDTVYTVL